MKRQIAIVSAGRTASTSLLTNLAAALQTRHSVRSIWDFSPAGALEEVYAQDSHDIVLVKGETFHLIELLRRRDRTTLVLLTRQNQFRQIVSHLVSLRAGRFHAAGGTPSPAPFTVSRHEFLFLAHMVLMTEAYLADADLSAFQRVERWRFEDMTADMDGHIRSLGITPPDLPTRMLGVGYSAASIANLDELREWASDLGLRVGPV